MTSRALYGRWVDHVQKQDKEGAQDGKQKKTG